MKRKEYKKPEIISESKSRLLPAIAVGAALAGGYVVGRGVKQAVEVRSDSFTLNSLNKVVLI